MTPVMTSEKKGSSEIIHFTGEIDMQSAAEIKAEFLRVFNSEINICIIDLSGVVEIDFTFSQLLLSLIKSMKSKGRSAVLSSLTDSCRAYNHFSNIGIIQELTFVERGSYGF